MRKKPFPVDKLINQLGGPTKAASALGIKNVSVVLNWRKRGQVAQGQVFAVEQLTGISRHDLRPDVFGPAPSRENAA